eukprot:TRINITY_DN3266_c0_g1_i2.p4 TRINITY_DN3266_c0_g1~~TRINITY_DN3266_c0_g1_i2.p4  ORF type:complete len:118 (+),score=1.90 TRINITY_DN3266_c0_g1_i2:72-425(+)
MAAGRPRWRGSPCHQNKTFPTVQIADRDPAVVEYEYTEMEVDTSSAGGHGPRSAATRALLVRRGVTASEVQEAATPNLDKDRQEHPWRPVAHAGAARPATRTRRSRPCRSRIATRQL